MITSTATCEVFCDADDMPIAAGERVYMTERTIAVLVVAAAGLVSERVVSRTEHLCGMHFQKLNPLLATELGL